jgi:hypothetical protein
MTKPHLIASASPDVDSATEPNGASGYASPSTLPPSLARLPADLQTALIEIRSAGRGLFGNKDTQSIFDDNLATLEQLYKLGASHLDVSQVMHDIGITRGDGEPLGAGTISSTISRARRASTQKHDRLSGRGRSRSGPRASVPPGVGQSGAALHDGAQDHAAASGIAGPLHALAVLAKPDPAPHRGDTDPRRGTSDRSEGGPPVSQTKAPHFEAAVSSTLARASPGDGDNSVRSRTAGRLLNQLRNDDDEI